MIFWGFLQANYALTKKIFYTGDGKQKFNISFHAGLNGNVLRLPYMRQ